MIPYRVQQVWHFLNRQPSEEDQAWVRSQLSPAQQALFFAQQPGDQAHAITVARSLIAEGYDDGRLTQAALLHDAGKAPGVALTYRTALVLLKKLHPGWLERLDPHRADWLAPLARATHHPALGAAYARAAGSDPAVVTLIHHHQDRAIHLGSELQPLLEALQRVDDAS
jgi:hypothetical protein